MKYGFLVHRAPMLTLNGEMIDTWQKSLVELYLDPDQPGMCFYRQGTRSKRGTYPNIHMSFAKLHTLWTAESVNVVQFFECSDLFERSDKQTRSAAVDANGAVDALNAR